MGVYEVLRAYFDKELFVIYHVKDYFYGSQSTFQ